MEPETQKGTLKCVSGKCKEQERENMLETRTAVDDAIYSTLKQLSHKGAILGENCCKKKKSKKLPPVSASYAQTKIRLSIP